MKRVCTLVFVVAVIVVGSLRPARAVVQNSGNTSPPYKGVCANGAVVMTRVSDHIEVFAYAATAAGPQSCNTWGPDRLLKVAFTMYWFDGEEVEVCGNDIAYPEWLKKFTDVLDLIDPLTGKRNIHHPGCGPGWYNARVRAYYYEDGKWRGGWVDSGWEYYDLPPVVIVL